MRDRLAAIEREAEWCAEDGAKTRAQRQAIEDARAEAEGRRPRRLDETPRQRAAAEVREMVGRVKKRRKG